MSFRIATLFVFASAACFAQTQITNSGPLTDGTTIEMDIVGPTITNAGSLPNYAVGSVPATSFHSSDWLVGLNVSSNGAGFIHEGRKPDARGPSLIQVKQSAARLTAAQLAPANYIALARSVGVDGPAEEAAILDAIHEADLSVYDFDKVDGYLYRQALTGTAVHWVWKPLRDKDVKPVAQAPWSQTGVGIVYAKLYTRKVPMSVLTEMKAVLATMPDAMFLVSDYEVIKPDPFLAVTTPKLLAAGKIWIVDQWDEPGFGGAISASATVARR